MDVLFKVDYKVKNYTFTKGYTYPVRETYGDKYIVTRYDGFEETLTKDVVEEHCVIIKSTTELTNEEHEWCINGTSRVVARLIKNMKTEKAIVELLEAYKNLDF